MKRIFSFANSFARLSVIAFNPPFVIKADGGFKLTPSGTKRAAEMAKAAK